MELAELCSFRSYLKLYNNERWSDFERNLAATVAHDLIAPFDDFSGSGREFRNIITAAPNNDQVCMFKKFVRRLHRCVEANKRAFNGFEEVQSFAFENIKSVGLLIHSTSGGDLKRGHVQQAATTIVCVLERISKIEFELGIVGIGPDTTFLKPKDVKKIPVVVSQPRRSTATAVSNVDDDGPVTPLVNTN